MILALIRHPRLNLEAGTCYGRTDFPLADPTEIPGIIAKIPFSPAKVIASPAGRCRQLAEAIASPEHIYDPRLLELDFGRWEGKSWNDISRAELDPWAADPLKNAPPGGETGAALIARVTTVFETLIASQADCAIVAHAGPLKVLSRLLRHHPPDLLAPSPPFGSIDLLILKANGHACHDIVE